jgi:hypothetical protein
MCYRSIAYQSYDKKYNAAGRGMYLEDPVIARKEIILNLWQKQSKKGSKK